MSRTTPDNVTEYEPEEVQALLAEGKILLVDVREPMEYAAGAYPRRASVSALEFRCLAVPAGWAASGGVLVRRGRTLTYRSPSAHGAWPAGCSPGGWHLAMESGRAARRAHRSAYRTSRSRIHGTSAGRGLSEYAPCTLISAISSTLSPSRRPAASRGRPNAATRWLPR